MKSKLFTARQEQSTLHQRPTNLSPVRKTEDSSPSKDGQSQKIPAL